MRPSYLSFFPSNNLCTCWTASAKLKIGWNSPWFQIPRKNLVEKRDNINDSRMCVVWAICPYSWRSHGIIKVGKELQDHRLQPVTIPQPRALNVMSSHLLNASRDEDPTTSLGSPFQCLTILSEKKILADAQSEPPWCSLRPFPLVTVTSSHLFFSKLSIPSSLSSSPQE